MNSENSHHEYFEFAYQTGSDIWTHIDYRQTALSMLPKHDNALVLDVGCGRGDWMFHLIKNNYRVLGLDYIESVINNINKNLKQKNLTNRGRGITGKVRNIPFTENGFDMITDIGTFQHLPKSNWQSYIDEVSHVLKSDGYYLNVSLSKKTQSLLGFKPTTSNKQTFEKFGLDYHFFTNTDIQNIFGKEFTILNQQHETYDSQSDPHDDIVLIFTLMQKNKPIS